MEFVDREVLGRFPKFDKTFIVRDHFGRPVKYQNLPILKQVMADVMYRKSRKDIEDFLPKIITMELPVELPRVVGDLYDFIAADCLEAIDAAIQAGSWSTFNVLAAYGRADDPKGRAMGDIMSRLTCMRLLCDHPSLLKASADEYDDPDSGRGSRYASWLKAEGYLDGVDDSTKLDAAVDLIVQILEESSANRVVLFAFFKPLLRMLRTRLHNLGIQAAMLTGDMNAQARKASLESFQREKRVLLSSDAGQYGIDLPHVNYLISYDLPWSAGAFAQRVARIDRTSSQFPHITVITMMAKNTIEQRQFDMLTQKRTVAEAWIDGQHIDAKGSLTLTLETLRSFLDAA
jgi:SNF2 family DNA or RNA helicase